MAALCTLLRAAEGESSLIFSRTKFGVERLGKQLSRLGFTVGTLHGNKSQHAREEVLGAFRRGHVQTLLATNVAARGLDIQGIYQVINYELPESSELFTHRIGRTGRMGRQGKAITLLVPSDVAKWRRMECSLGQKSALQRLTIDEQASVVVPLPARPEFSVTQEQEQNNEQQVVRGRKPFMREQEQNNEQQVVRGRKPFTRDQERDKFAQPKPEGRRASDIKRRQQEESSSSGTPVRQSEGLPLLEYGRSGKARDGKRVAGEQSSLGRITGKHKVHANKGGVKGAAHGLVTEGKKKIGKPDSRHTKV
jgi:superfamily II DNA/RNA helicase